MVKYTHKTHGGITREEIIDRNNSSSYGGGEDKIKLVYWSNQRHDMEYVENYLCIQKVIFSDKFDYEIVCGPDVGRYRIVKVLLQPLGGKQHGPRFCGH